MSHFPFSFFLLIHFDTFCSTVAFSQIINKSNTSISKNHNLVQKNYHLV